jgi:hypothetical protein
MPLKRIITLAFYLLVLIWAGVGFYMMLVLGNHEGKAAQWLADPNIQKGTAIVMSLSYLLTVVMVLSVVFSAVLNYIQNPKMLMRALMGLGVLVVVFLIGYALAGNEVTLNYEKFGVNASQSKLIGGILNATYILVIVAAVAYLYSSINSLLKQL